MPKLKKKVIDLSQLVTKEDARHFATKEDLKELATKNDLKQFATKDDLKRFATKDDLKRFATKDDLKRFATKNDLAVSEKRIIGAMKTMMEVRDSELQGAHEDELDIMAGEKVAPTSWKSIPRRLKTVEDEVEKIKDRIQ